jgi:hypothetical protein
MLNREQAARYIADELAPLCEQYGARIVAANPASFCDFVTLTYKGKVFSLNQPEATFPLAVAFFLQHFEEIEEITAEVLAMEEPFHFDINERLCNRFGYRQPTKTAHLYICDRLIEAGKTID